MSDIVVLHSANTTIPNMQRLVAPTGIPGYNLWYPAARNGERWDHLGYTDTPALHALGGDYIVGMSSGAFMAMRMARERQYKAMCIVAGGLLENYIKNAWQFPCPVLIIHGTADRNVPYEGVPLMYEAGMDAALALKDMLGASYVGGAQVSNNNWADGCRAYVESWGKVVLYTVVNGGHTWPGSPHNLPAWMGGRTCMDFSATEVMTYFFQRFP